MRKLILVFAFALAFLGVHAQTLISRSYDITPVISYTVYEPQKDTVYYWKIQHVIDIKNNITEGFYLRFRKKNNLINTLKFMLSLENEEVGRTYRLDSTMDCNEVTIGKIDGFLLVPTVEGLSISNVELKIPSSIFYSFDTFATLLKQLDVEATSLRKKKKDDKRNGIRNQKNLDDAYKY